MRVAVEKARSDSWHLGFLIQNINVAAGSNLFKDLLQASFRAQKEAEYTLLGPFLATFNIPLHFRIKDSSIAELKIKALNPFSKN